MRFGRLLFVLLSVSLFAVDDCSAQENKSEIRIPAIVHSWKSTSSSDDADISFDEISTCVDVDLKIRTRISELRREKLALDEEFDSLPKADAQIAMEAKALELENQRLKNLVAAANANQEVLAARKIQLERSRPSANAAPDQTRRFNGSVAEFNAALTASNLQSESLNEALNAFRTRVEKFNATIDEINARTMPFNKRSEDFRIASIEFRNSYGGFLNKCAGERKLRK